MNNQFQMYIIRPYCSGSCDMFVEARNHQDAASRFAANTGLTYRVLETEPRFMIEIGTGNRFTIELK